MLTFTTTVKNRRVAGDHPVALPDGTELLLIAVPLAPGAAVSSKLVAQVLFGAVLEQLITIPLRPAESFLPGEEPGE